MSATTRTQANATLAHAEAKLEVTAQILSFEPGLYAVDVQAPQIVRGASGMTVPAVRLDPINGGDGARAFVSALSDTPLIQAGDPSAYLRVQGAKASVLLTIYKLAGGMPAPELRISLVQPPVARIPEARAAALASEPLTLVAHVERAGDITVQGGSWVGQPGSRGAIEGFAITPGAGIDAAEIEYQAVLGSDWTTPWLAGSEFCGSRGLSLPLLGVRIRLRGDTARDFTCTYWGSFVGAGESGPTQEGAVCAKGGTPLEALRVVLTRRVALAAPEPEVRPAAKRMQVAAPPSVPPRSVKGKAIAPLRVQRGRK